MNKTRAKFGIFILAFILLATNAISPAMASIKAAFPEASASTVNTILLIPQLMSVPFVIFGGAIAGKFSKKRLIIIGLILFAGSGVVGFFTDSLAVLIASRAAFGVGYGLLVPCSLGIASDIFFGTDEYDKIIGMEYSLKSIGSIFYTMIAGVLCEISWHHTFLVYLTGAVVLVVIFFVIPDIPPEKTKRETTIEKNSNQKSRAGIPAILIPAILMGFVYSFCIQINGTNFSFVIERGGFGTSWVSGLVTSTVTVGAAVGAAAYDWILKKLGDRTFLFGMLCCTAGFAVGAAAVHVSMLFICAVLLGFGLGMVNPALLMLVGRESKESSTFYFSLIMASMNLGAMVQGWVVPSITAAIFGGDGQGKNAFIVAAVGMAVCVVLGILMLLRFGNKKGKAEAV